MSIITRNEVLVTCENTPLMELLEHLAKDHAPDLDYCLDELGLTYTAASKPQEVRTRQEFFNLPIGTVVKIPHVGTYYKIGISSWVKQLPESRPIHGNDAMWSFTISVNAPATVMFTPEVQA
ncbi:hypothetical protein [Corynebacterium phoceense]|uniref:hypothetical protein n=1 Tax=Corynebacterium phoceense TaxID=1686286 RepID=UPI000839C856|nr:hypothetical protein [Corynebacterium phoceense]